MKVAQVPIYLDLGQVKLLRWDMQEAVLAADEDLEVTMQIGDITARRLAREEIAGRGRSTRKPSTSSTRHSRSSNAEIMSCERATEHTPR